MTLTKSIAQLKLPPQTQEHQPLARKLFHLFIKYKCCAIFAIPDKTSDVRSNTIVLTEVNFTFLQLPVASSA